MGYKDNVFRYFQKVVQDENIEIVFVSGDKDPDEMKACMEGSHGDWLAVDNSDLYTEQIRKALQNEYYPELVVLKSDGTIVTKKGIKDINKYGSEAISVWKGENPPRRHFNLFHKICK